MKCKYLMFGDFSEMKYGKMPRKDGVKDIGKYPVYSGYRIVGYYDEYNVDEPTLIVVARGVGGTGDVKISPSKCWLTNLSISVVVDENVAIKEYLYYYFKVHNLRYLDSGSAQSQITISDLSRKEIILPTIDVQKKIVKFLKCFDDKIENNTAINRNLYEQAVALFESTYQSYPERKIGELDILVTDYVANGSFASLKKNVTILEEKDYAYFIRNVDLKAKDFSRFVNQHSYEFLSKSKLVGGEVIISNVGDVGSVFLCPKLDGPMTLGNNIIMLTSSKHNNYLYLFFKSYIGQGKIDSITGGSAQPKFNKTDFKSLEINYPDDWQIDTFNENTAVLLNMISKLDEENKRLTVLRDCLLTKLMSGELDVSNIEI